MDKATKLQRVEELNALFENNTGVILLDFTGVNVAAETELRRKMAEAGCGYRVVKNTLAKRAVTDGAAEALDAYFSGPTAVAYTDDNPAALAKTATEFVKAHPTTTLKAGLLDQNLLSVEELQALADLPSHEELLGKLVHLLQAPLMNLASTLQGPLQSLAYQLSRLESGRKQS